LTGTQDKKIKNKDRGVMAAYILEKYRLGAFRAKDFS
jgi:hypothetical protein